MNFVETQIVVMVFLLIFCFVDFQYDFKRKIVKDSKVLVAYCLITACFLQGFFFYISNMNFKSVASSMDKESQVNEMIHMIEAWSLEICLVFVVVNAFMNRKGQQRLLNNILKIERICNKLKYQPRVENIKENLRWKSTSLVFGTFTFLFIIFIIFLTNFYSSNHTAMINISVDLFLTCLNNLIVIFMVFVIQMIHNLFKIINLNIDHKIKEINFWMTSFNMLELLQLLKIHNRLQKSIKLFNESFGMTILGIHIYNIGTITSELYLAFLITRDFVEIDFLIFFFYVTVNIVWCAPLIFNLCLMSSACNNVKDDVEALILMTDQLELKDFKTNETRKLVKIGFLCKFIFI